MRTEQRRILAPECTEAIALFVEDQPIPVTLRYTDPRDRLAFCDVRKPRRHHYRIEQGWLTLMLSNISDQLRQVSLSAYSWRDIDIIGFSERLLQALQDLIVTKQSAHR